MEPWDYPSELEDCVALPDQRLLRIRPLRAGEDAAIRDLDAHLSVRTRYRRFFSPMTMLPDSLLQLLSTVDYRRRLALVAEADNGNRREIVALGSFAAIDDGAAEVALLVSDEWQHLGIGTVLADRILQAADARGFTRFVASVFCDNAEMRRIVDRIGRVVSAHSRMGVCELTFVRRFSQAA
jgi:RimJ/RimL family protein N-acetyltransferase